MRKLEKKNLKDNVAFCVTTLFLSKAMETSFVKFTCLFHVCVQNEEQGHDKKSNRLYNVCAAPPPLTALSLHLLSISFQYQTRIIYPCFFNRNLTSCVAQNLPLFAALLRQTPSNSRQLHLFSLEPVNFLSSGGQDRYKKKGKQIINEDYFNRINWKLDGTESQGMFSPFFAIRNVDSWGRAISHLFSFFLNPLFLVSIALK